MQITALRQKLDSHKVLEMIADMPRHLEEGMKIGLGFNGDGIEPDKINCLVVAGMGGSAIAGDIARCFLADIMPNPIIVNRNYRLPQYVDKRALVICSSYSGNTEETLAAYDDARVKGARIIVIASGGQLSEKAMADRNTWLKIPSGFPPRAALGYSFSVLLAIIFRLHLCSKNEANLSKVIALLTGLNPLYQQDSMNNPAIELAHKLSGRFPVIYSGCEKLEAVVTRFRCQINENAETLAFVNFFPELNHNEIVGWHKLHALESKFSVVILRDTADHDRVKARIAIVVEYLKDKGIAVQIIDSRGETALERIFYLIQYLDFTSYYLALLNGVDPYSIDAIDYLKEKLAQLNRG